MQLRKRLREVIEAKIPDYMFKYYPQLLEFIYSYTDFIDQEVGQDILNFTQNLNPDYISTKFLDQYFNQYCSQLINTEQYQITDKNKRLFLSIAKFFYKNKGKKFSFDIVLKYLTQFFVFRDENFIDVIDYEIIEDKNGWFSKQLEDLSYNSYSNPFTYIIRGDFPKSLIVTMIENLNPVGFYPEFQFSQLAEETYFNISLEEYEIITTHQPNIEEIYRGDWKISEIYSISVNADIGDESNIEIYNQQELLLLANGRYLADGSKIANGVDAGMYELFEISVFDDGVLIETLESTLNEDV